MKASIFYLGACVEYSKFRLQRGHCEFVHFDVLPVEVNVGDAVLHVGLVPERVRAQVKDFHVTVVVARCHYALFVAKGIAKRHGLTVAHRLAVVGL